MFLKGKIMKRKLYKSEDNRLICGVCGGLGEFFGVDATIVRLIWVLLTLLGGSGVLLYLIAAILIPREPV